MFLLDLLIQILLHGCNTYHVLLKNTKIRWGLDFIYDLICYFLAKFNFLAEFNFLTKFS